nr:four helix bundle protein [Rhodopirellula sp. SM50]
MTQLIYRCSRQDDFARDFALKDQIRRASISITSNIAEGFERDGNKEFVQFLSHAKASCGEVRSQLYVAYDERYLDEHEFEDLQNKCREISRLINGFINYLNKSDFRGPKYIRELRDPYMVDRQIC